MNSKPVVNHDLQSLISKEVEKQLHSKVTNEKNIIKRLKYYENKIHLLEEQLVLLKNNF